MKAVVLTRGLGRRMRAGEVEGLTPEQAAAAAAGLKAMMPVGPPSPAGPHRFLDHVLHELADAGVDRVALVVAPEHAEIRHWYRELVVPSRLAIDFVVQAEPRGTAHAVLAAESWVGSDEFLVVNGDNLYPADVLRRLVALGRPGLVAFERNALVVSGNIPAGRVGAFATIDATPQGDLIGLVEKPGAEAVRVDALVSMNCWRFDARIFPMCRAVVPSPRGEIELPAAVQHALAHGVSFRIVRAAAAVLDLSSRVDIAGVTRRLAQRAVRL